MKKRFKRKPGKSLTKQEAYFGEQTFRVLEYDSKIFKTKDFQRLRVLLKDIPRLPTLLSLQKRLVIWNINEFMIREKPTFLSFDEILKVQVLWSSRFLFVVNSNKETTQEYLDLLEEVRSVAMNRFIILSAKDEQTKKLTKR